jgi:bifunctional ADP-heptose synthase (sugar kinase/adenylyltransferase)
MISPLAEKYQHKVKTVEELMAILGPRPRKKKVIMCHGVFDVVHPGHLRHFIYSKSKADILVASLTADRHITKGTYRPQVPQHLRALNLAAYEVVDYVLIDANDKPLENLQRLQPDLFAKGYEYVDDLNPKTREEADVVTSYGGDMIFTPGDVVYSSSRFIEMQSPDLRTDKLLTLMDVLGITFVSLRNTLSNFAGKRVHVVGDTIVDSLTQCTMIGGQTKTPTMSVLFQQRKDYIGGAAIVAEHLRSTGAEVTLSTVLGADPLKEFVLGELTKHGVETRAIVDSTRPTVNKNAIIAEGYRLLKVDTLDNRSISDDIQRQLAAGISDVKADAVVFADFRHGIFNRRTIPALVGGIPEGVLRVADSQVASRWGNITDFKNFDVITPNEREARFALADQDSGIRALAGELYKAAACKTLIMKLGGRGVITCQSADDRALDSFLALDSFVDNVRDAVGAGDALLAYATLSILATGNPGIATILGSVAAAVECELEGNVAVRPIDVLGKLDRIEKRARYEI